MLLRKFGKFDGVNAAALAAHYGSVSAVTFGEALAFLEILQVSAEPYVAALLAVMEVPAIIVAIFLVGKATIKAGGGSIREVLRELITSKSIVLLIGGMVIGLLAGKKGAEQVAPLFDAPFRGVLTLFLLEVGLVTGRRLGDLKHAGCHNFRHLGRQCQLHRRPSRRAGCPAHGESGDLSHGVAGIDLPVQCHLRNSGLLLFRPLARSGLRDQMQEIKANDNKKALSLCGVDCQFPAPCRYIHRGFV
jgi:hypothetical protein